MCGIILFENVLALSTAEHRLSVDKKWRHIDFCWLSMFREPVSASAPFIIGIPLLFY